MKGGRVSPDNLIGKKLGDYVLRRKLATGGMSYIYIGEDEKLERKAAIKILTPDMQRGDAILSARFEREARAIAALEHDSIIPIYQFGQYLDMYFLAMRYIEGRDLAGEIQVQRAQGKLLDVHRAFYILEQVAGALDYAHEHGIIHRDVKPSNVLLGANDRAYLSDFGLVLWQKVEASIGTAFGTPRYISPEQATDSTTVVPQSDIYSLAVMMYEILTGAQLFEGPHPVEVALAHVTRPPTPPRAHNPAIPQAAQDELLRALSKNPADRHQTALDFMTAMKQAYADAATSPTPVLGGEKSDSGTPLLSERERRSLLNDSATAAAGPSVPAPRTTNPELVIGPDTGLAPRRNVISYVLAGVVVLAAVVVLLSSLGGGSPDPAQPATSTPPLPTIAQLNPAGDPVAAAATATVTLPATPDSPAATDSPATLPPATDSPANAATPLPGVGGPVALRLYYTPTAFALVNTTGQTLVISDLVLTGLTGDAEDAFRNSGSLGTTLLPGGCLLIFSARSDGTVPPEWGCDSSASQTTLSSDKLFWFANTREDTQFAVQDGPTTIATCATIGRAVGRLDPLTCEAPWSRLAEG
jgi:serine/threonine-protein kinase